MMPRCYLDHNATSALRPEAREAMLQALDYAGNPSSVHAEGRAARRIVVEPDSVYFTASGTEAANWLLQPRGQEMLAVSAVEHPCILSGHRFAADKCHILPVSQAGTLDPASLGALLAQGSVAAIQAANNETGVIQPAALIAD